MEILRLMFSYKKAKSMFIPTFLKTRPNLARKLVIGGRDVLRLLTVPGWRTWINKHFLFTQDERRCGAIEA